jgi:murein DD-endopeptidase MepM/ murein hydrolase activator NlpD
VVVSAGVRGGYGNAVVIDHGGGLATLYAHQQRMYVSAGQRVERGQQIGEIGSTGFSTGPHLHFEVRVNGATRDPMGYL